MILAEDKLSQKQIEVLNFSRVLFLTLIYMTSLVPAFGQSSSELSIVNWEEDIDFLVLKMEKTIPEFTERINQDDFKLQIQKLKEGLGSYNESKIVMELQRLLNLVGDGGCRIYPFQERLDYHILPLMSYWFKEGLFICDANEKYQNLVGRQIIEVNGMPISEIYQKMEGFLNADNIHYQKYLFPVAIQLPEWLVANGIGEDINDVTLTLASNMNTERRQITIFAEEVSEYVKLNRKLAGFRQVSSRYQAHENEAFWMEYLADEKIIFIQFLQIGANGSSFKKFIAEIEKTLKTKDVDKVIIDNRFGGGGNGFKLKPFTDLIRDDNNINQSGKLFVLTSRTTRGTVMELTSILELNTKAIFIGEPTGEGPNTVGDITYIELPNSKLKVSLTHKFWPTSWDIDTRRSISPHVEIDYTHKDYLQQSDPWLEAVKGYSIIGARPNVPGEIAKGLSGNYEFNGRKVNIGLRGDALYLSMSRKMISFFELNTQLYLRKEQELSTDIRDVYLNYTKDGNGNITVISLDWKGHILKVEE